MKNALLALCCIKFLIMCGALFVIRWCIYRIWIENVMWCFGYLLLRKYNKIKFLYFVSKIQYFFFRKKTIKVSLLILKFNCRKLLKDTLPEVSTVKHTEAFSLINPNQLLVSRSIIYLLILQSFLISEKYIW